MYTSYSSSNYKNKTQNTLNKIANGYPMLPFNKIWGGGGGGEENTFLQPFKNKMTINY